MVYLTVSTADCAYNSDVWQFTQREEGSFPSEIWIAISEDMSFEFGRPKTNGGRSSIRKESHCLHCMQHFEQIDECWTGFNSVFTSLAMMFFQQCPLASMASHICNICYCTAAFNLSSFAALWEQKSDTNASTLPPLFFFFVSFPKKQQTENAVQPLVILARSCPLYSVQLPLTLEL